MKPAFIVLVLFFVGAVSADYFFGDIAWVQPKLTPHPWKCFEQKLVLTNEAAMRKVVAEAGQRSPLRSGSRAVEEGAVGGGVRINDVHQAGGVVGG